MKASFSNDSSGFVQDDGGPPVLLEDSQFQVRSLETGATSGVSQLSGVNKVAETEIGNLEYVTTRMHYIFG